MPGRAPGEKGVPQGLPDQTPGYSLAVPELRKGELWQPTRISQKPLGFPPMSRQAARTYLL
jgi:hypothetical protein